MNQQPTTLTDRVTRLVNINPWLTFLASIASIAGLGIAILYPLFSQSKVDITYALYPGRTQIVQAGKISDLSVLYKGAPIEGGVTSVALQIWNNGKLPISGDSRDLLEPLRIVVGGSHRILSATLLRVSRDTCAIKLDESQLSHGLVPVDFRILEHNDGAIVQLIYEGDVKVSVEAKGVFVGQSVMSSLTFGTAEDADNASDPRPLTFWRIVVRTLLTIFTAALFLFGFALLFTGPLRRGTSVSDKVANGLLSLLFIGLASALAHFVYHAIVDRLPLPFN